jgi:hypothetical protein
VAKLSIANIQNKLIEAEQTKKVKFEEMKRNGTRIRAVGALGDPSTKITKLKQINIKNNGKPTSDKGSTQLWNEADYAGTYVDKMERGIFRDNAGSNKPKTPKVDKMKPNQTTVQKKVSPNMQKNDRKSQSDEMQVVPRTAQMAGTYVDALPRGNIFSNDSEGTGLKAPSAKNLHQTTRPGKTKHPVANMTRHPNDKPKGPNSPDDAMPMPSDAPPKRSVAKPKAGIIVRVNENIKAKFNIVSEAVLYKMVESFRNHGYKVIIERMNKHPIWATDKKFQNLMYENVAAKENQSYGLHQKIRNAAMNQLYKLCINDYNNLYETREEFLNTIKEAFRQIEKNAIISYRKGNELFVCNARLITENKLSDVEILTEATDHQTALRLVRNKLFEAFGLNTDIKAIFIDGKKYSAAQIKEWLPTRIRI